MFSLFDLFAGCCEDVMVKMYGNEIKFEKAYQKQLNNHSYYNSVDGDWIVQYCYEEEDGGKWEIREK